jgi:hypothetical protein
MRLANKPGYEAENTGDLTKALSGKQKRLVHNCGPCPKRDLQTKNAETISMEKLFEESVPINVPVTFQHNGCSSRLRVPNSFSGLFSAPPIGERTPTFEDRCHAKTIEDVFFQ